MAPYVRADVRRAQLLEASEAVLVRDGLDRLTLRAVAEEAGVRLSTLQYIFSSRAELVSALAERVIERRAQTGPTIGSRGLVAELTDLIDYQASAVLSERGLMELIRSELVAGANATLSTQEVHYPGGRSILGEMLGERVVEVCARSAESYSQSPEVLSHLWARGLTGMVWAFLRDGDDRAFRREGMILVEALTALANPQPRA